MLVVDISQLSSISAGAWQPHPNWVRLDGTFYDANEQFSQGLPPAAVELLVWVLFAIDMR